MLESRNVNGVVVGDDWGFNTQTLFPVEMYRKFLFPYHKQIVKMAHESGRCAILHSCGRFDEVLGDIIEEIGYDARHSYEDGIVPIEKAYPMLYPQIAVLGGLDVHFLATASAEEIQDRVHKLLDMTGKGGYALGSGNSIPSYIPWEKYTAMLQTVFNRE